MGLLMALTLLWRFISKPSRTAEYCRLKRISESYLFCVKNVKPFHFHDVTEMGNICFLLKRKQFNDSQSSTVFDDILFDRKPKILVKSYSTYIPYYKLTDANLKFTCAVLMT